MPHDIVVLEHSHVKMGIGEIVKLEQLLLALKINTVQAVTASFVVKELKIVI